MEILIKVVSVLLWLFAFGAFILGLCLSLMPEIPAQEKSKAEVFLIAAAFLAAIGLLLWLFSHRYKKRHRIDVGGYRRW